MRGAGLMMLGGRSSFGAGGWADTAVADVLPTNRAMLTVFRSAGYEVRRDLADAGQSHARRLFMQHRRPELYGAWVAPSHPGR